MRNFFNSAREDYLQGYSKGFNPYSKNIIKKNNESFNFGFLSGRQDYESMNGPIIDGIPQRIVSEKVLEDFLLAGLLGLSVDTEGYNAFQLNVLAKWYQSGTEKYEPAESDYLSNLLEDNGIMMNENFYM
jgi:hypothetical protein